MFNSKTQSLLLLSQIQVTNKIVCQRSFIIRSLCVNRERLAVCPCISHPAFLLSSLNSPPFAALSTASHC